MLALDELPTQKSENQKDSLRDRVEHRGAARLIVADEHRARDFLPDIARGGGRLEQGVGDEISGEGVGECGVAHGKSEEEEPGVARLEGVEDHAGEDREERVELRELRRGGRPAAGGGVRGEVRMGDMGDKGGLDLVGVGVKGSDDVELVDHLCYAIEVERVCMSGASMLS